MVAWGPLSIKYMRSNCKNLWSLEAMRFGVLTHWGWVSHICVSELTIIGSDNGLSPGQRQAIMWTNAEILLIGPWGTNFSEISIEIYTFSFKKMHLKMLFGKWRPFCCSINVLNQGPIICCLCSQLWMLFVSFGWSNGLWPVSAKPLIIPLLKSC